MPTRTEFIALCAILMCIVALSVDIMLPALGDIATTFALEIDNERQLAIVMLFAGLTVGHLFFGPCSDATGRKSMIYLGLVAFCAGSILCAVAETFETFLTGRVIQGFGAAGPRIVTVAMIRDRFKGREMAQMISVIMGVFILVPVIAPSLGQALLFLMPWRGLFIVLACVGLVGGTWLAVRQQETLHVKTPIRAKDYLDALNALMRSRVFIAYAIIGGLVYGAFLGYINTAQQLFQDTYGLGNQFALWFGAAAIFVSAATFINAKLVQYFRMAFLCLSALSVLVIWCALFGVAFHKNDYIPKLESFMLFNGVCLFLMGLTFGNFNSIALSPFGHIAGMASAVIATIQSIGSLLIAWAIGYGFDGSIFSILVGYFCCSLSAIVIILILDPSKPWQTQHVKES